MMPVTSTEKQDLIGKTLVNCTERNRNLQCMPVESQIEVCKRAGTDGVNAID